MRIFNRKRKSNKNMAEKSNKEQQDSKEQTESQAEQTVAASEETGAQEMPESGAGTTEKDEWKEKYDELNDSYLRTLAEYENYRKRTIREKAELLESAGENILKIFCLW